MSSEPPIDEFVAGGYFLVRPKTTLVGGAPRALRPGVEGDPLLSVSPCLANVLPDAVVVDGGWGHFPPLTDEVRARAAATWGLAADAAADAADWSANAWRRGRLLHQQAFVDADIVRELVRRFLPVTTDARIVGVGLHREACDGFLDAVRRAQVETGCPGALNGVRDGIERGVPVAGGGRRLGYEVLDVEASGTLHSWRCHGPGADVGSPLELDTALGGLITRHDDAVRIASLHASAEIGCEPGVWRAFVVIEYSR